MRARNVALLLTAALVVYLVLLADRAIELFATGSPAGIALGVGVFVLPLLGVWIVVATWRSGLQIQRLSRRLDAEGVLPDVSDLPRRPSGRVDRTAADAWFDQRRTEVEAAPDDWRGWYRLAYAYDIAGDRRRARATMRKAVDLEAAESGKTGGVAD
ncbi:tetratricopeptide repeat protein [Amycolatopsis rhabdoformis]|uniref:Tetratricopeptide repeat protein n=1 Tax=Amycolatopsis rhabdoformis TaxID=1448059 RepID=A0ABZ1ILG2_9PSEU|nr:tetratricopeptide repeat protein [Amycolatopsis rhabdoformis]WSE34429.1 tetratricopeptide repeat protein [Amycolatopsis rhabdoformis]